MPVWQPHRPWLLEAVHSALGQRSCAVEVVVVDDGNGQRVEELLSDVADRRLRHVRVEHGGVSHARNAGLAAASAPFIRFVDADDVSELDSTARLLELAAGGAIAYEDTVVCDPELQPKRRISSRLAGDISVPCLLGRFDSRHVSMLFPRTVIEAAGPWDTRLRVREDFDFVLRCLEHAPAVPGEGTATYYRRHDASATRSQSAIREAERATRAVVAGFFSRHPQLRGTSVEREVRARMHAAESTTALTADRPLEALGHVGPLLRVAPREAAGLAYRVGRCAVRLARDNVLGTAAGGRPTPR